MKFGKRIAREQLNYAPYAGRYVGYKRLKGAIKALRAQREALLRSAADAAAQQEQQAPEQQQEQQQQLAVQQRAHRDVMPAGWERPFLDALARDAEVVDATFRSQVDVLAVELGRLVPLIEAAVERGGAGALTADQPEVADFGVVCGHLTDLRAYVLLNFIAFAKILKKFDKKLEHSLSGPVMASLRGRDFYRSDALARLLTQAECAAGLISGVTPRVEDYSCGICLNLLCNPVVLSCVHRFCWACLARAAHFGVSCPLCRKEMPLDPRHYQIEATLHKYVSRHFPQQQPGALAPQQLQQLQQLQLHHGGHGLGHGHLPHPAGALSHPLHLLHAAGGRGGAMVDDGDDDDEDDSDAETDAATCSPGTPAHAFPAQSQQTHQSQQQHQQQHHHQQSARARGDSDATMSDCAAAAAAAAALATHTRRPSSPAVQAPSPVRLVAGTVLPSAGAVLNGSSSSTSSGAFASSTSASAAAALSSSSSSSSSSLAAAQLPPHSHSSAGCACERCPPAQVGSPYPVRITRLADILRHAHAGTLVCLDLDETLVMSPLPSSLFSPRGVEVFQDMVRTMAATPENKAMVARFQQILDHKVPVEGTTLEVVRELQKRGCWVMGLTARYFSMAESTQSMLARLGLDLTVGQPAHLPVVEGLQDPETSAVFANGVIYTNACDKGVVLNRYLYHVVGVGVRSDVSVPREVVFVDDRHSNAESVIAGLTLASQLAIPVHSYHYLGAEVPFKRLDPHFDEMVREQFRYYFDSGGSVLTDDDACARLAVRGTHQDGVCVMH